MSKDKQVWFVNRDLPPVFSGGGKNDALMATLLPGFGFVPTLVGQKKGGECSRERYRNVDVLRIGDFDKTSGKLLWGFLLFIAVISSKERPLLIRFRGFNFGFAVAISLLKRFVPSVRLATQPACFGTDDPESILGKAFGRWQLAQLKKCDAIFAMNGLYSQAFMAHGYPESRIYPVRNPVTLSDIPPEADRSRIRQRVGIENPEDFLILTIGILDVRKRQGFITRALCQAMASVPSRRVVLAHVGPNSEDLSSLNRPDKVRAAKIVEGEIEAARLACPSCVDIKLLGHRDDVPDLLSAADLFIHASTSEGEANVVNEAMAMGVAVIVPRHPIYSLQVNDAVSCVFEPDSEESLAATIHELVADNDKRSQLGKNARRHVIETRSPENAAAYYADILSRITS
ncbi:MAG TPA: glycosyltransferase family 4 protein [Gammaproteobacteria bacterium]